MTHLDFFLYLQVYKCSVHGQMAQLSGMFIYPVVHLVECTVLMHVMTKPCRHQTSFRG